MTADDMTILLNAIDTAAYANIGCLLSLIVATTWRG